MPELGDVLKPIRRVYAGPPPTPTEAGTYTPPSAGERSPSENISIGGGGGGGGGSSSSKIAREKAAREKAAREKAAREKLEAEKKRILEAQIKAAKTQEEKTKLGTNL